MVVDGFTTDGLPLRLSSQRFYDDCERLLAADGVLVVNLHCGHRNYATWLERLRRAFGGEVLVVEDGELSNGIVFACKGAALARATPGAVRRPKGLAPAGAAQLVGAFARVSQALKDRGGA
jgi:spermidine synthase